MLCAPRLDRDEATRATELHRAHRIFSASGTGTCLTVALDSAPAPDKQGTVAMRPAKEAALHARDGSEMRLISSDFASTIEKW
jgi:hypothetical protein